MFDSGASTHMIGNGNLLPKIENTQPVLIDLPNGAQTLSTKQGTVALGDGTNLSNMLIVHNLSSNLVSIARIAKDLNYSVTFFYDCCVLPDRTLGMSIDAGE